MTNINLAEGVITALDMSIEDHQSPWIDRDDAIALVSGFNALQKRVADLTEVATALRRWIDAVPEEVVATLPAMPGTDREWVDSVIAGGDQ